jgi:MoxR-like ATPase
MPVPQGTRKTGGRSCTTCPAFLSGRDQTVNLGSNLNGPICGIKMLPLVMPKQGADTSKRVLSHVATNCDKYGTDVKFEPLSLAAAPDLRVGMDADLEEPPAEQPSTPSCYTCANYVNSQVVQGETGWTGSICRATGNLMPDNRLDNYSKKCGRWTRRVGPSSDRQPKLQTFTFFPQFSGNFGIVDVTANYRISLDHFIDPTKYQTDRPVSERAKQRGIRAWRQIVDPDGYGEPVYLPVYDIERFPEAERVLVPRTGDSEHPELYADHGQLTYTMAVLWMKLDETPAWWGQGGTGKTEFARHLAWMMCLPFHRINITASTEVDDLAGKILFENNETVIHYGRLSEAWGKPGIILLDEPNTGPPEVWQIIRPLTDNSRLLILDMLKHERIKRHLDCYFTLAMNPPWDMRNVGTQTIGDADGSRLMHMYFSYPPEDLEREIIQRRCKLDGWEVPPDQMRALMKVTKELRDASDTGVLHSTWGVRHNLKVARALRWFTPIKAYWRAVGDYLEPSQRDVVHTIVKSQFGE